MPNNRKKPTLISQKKNIENPPYCSGSSSGDSNFQDHQEALYFVSNVLRCFFFLPFPKYSFENGGG
ncbi:9421_t:CDS:2 [Ambispora gerdemannii]|uniref:9421_t:CDS:1 n=1 Tax=Ambispora gerdemannii TaxID=144530 RepID=A0A9N8VVR3_9GLOM|nr:9421_t:CDS:2 [Ambispora gerdemannii]